MNNTDNKDKPEILKRMSSVVSHELRNPLAIISNSLYFIRTKLGAGGAELDPKVAKHMGIIESEVKHSNEVPGLVWCDVNAHTKRITFRFEPGTVSR